MRIEVLDGSISGPVLDQVGPTQGADCRRLIRVGARYLPSGVAPNAEAAKEFLAYLQTDKAMTVFEGVGFSAV